MKKLLMAMALAGAAMVASAEDNFQIGRAHV